MKDLYYVVEENGYHIYDRNDGLLHVHQYEPYIPDKSKTYEENAQAQIHEYMVSNYASAVISGEITIDDVPEDYKAEGEEIVNSQEQLYTLDEASAIIAQEVSA